MIRKKSTKELEKERQKNREKLKTDRAPVYVIADSIRSLDNVSYFSTLRAYKS